MPNCRNRGDVFQYNAGYLRNEMLNDIGNASNNINDCQTICWSNCSCIGFKNSNVNGTGFTSAAHNKCMYLATTITYHLEVFYGSINIRFIQVSSLLRISVESKLNPVKLSCKVRDFHYQDNPSRSRVDICCLTWVRSSSTPQNWLVR